MKNKPLRHKEFNTFKFKPFSERIADINIDVFHAVGHKYEKDDADEADTFFYSAYRKWNGLNKSENYNRFKNEIDLCCVKTLPELLLKKDHVVGVLLEYLEFKDPLSLQAFLELVVALARDLMQDFYVYYPKFHTKLVNLLNTKDTDQLEWVFTCFAHLYKSLWRYIVKDFGTILDSLLPLLSDSNPLYINNFAADSFAFVARKMKDKRTFLKLILNSIYRTKDGISGFGRLLFVTVSGVCGRFHSCAEPLMNFLLRSLADDKLQRNLLFQVLDNMVEHMTNKISPEHSQIFWNIIQDIFEEFVNCWKETGDERYVKGLEFISRLSLKVIKWRDLLWLKDCQVLFKCLDSIKDIACEELQMLVADIVSVILTSSRVLLSQEQANSLISKVFSVTNRAIVKTFVEKTFKYSGFDSFILPKFINFSLAEHPDDTVDIWTKIILYKAPPPTAEAHVSLSRRYAVNSQSITSNEESFSRILLDRFIKLYKEEDPIDNAERIISILIVMPHFEPLQADDALIGVSNLLESVCDVLHNRELFDGSKILKALLVSLLSMECILLIKNFKSVSEINFPDRLFEILSKLPMEKQSHKVLVLNCLKLLLDENSELFKEKIRNSFWDELVCDLSSPYHQVRLLSANILLKLLKGENDEEIMRCLSVIVKAESLPSTFHDYREKLKLLQRIECCPAVLESKYKIFPLHYLLGILYVNLKLLWEPVVKLITSYALQLPKAEFWPVFHSKLVSVKEAISKQDEEKVITEEISFQNSELSSFYNKVNALDDKPDYWNYRNMLWRAMPEFPEVCESKNRDVVPLFLTFLQEEYYRTNSDVGTGWNVRLDHKKDDMEISDGNVNDDDDELNKETGVGVNDGVLKTPIHCKSATKSLLAHLCIFEKINDPRSMYREADLKSAYYGLLTHKNPQVQKSALECIMTYKYKHITPYRDHLFGLIDDKSFKDEIVLFRIDQESDMVRPEHRSDLIPVVMRIIYSKMLNKSGSRTGSKSAGQLRRTLVFRFLAGCLPDEIMMYLRMAFRIYLPFIKDDPMEIVKLVDSTLDLGSMIPPRRLQSSVNLLMVVLTHCGGMMNSSMLSYLLRILISIGQIVASALKQRDVIHPGYVSALKSIRNSSLDALSKFFSLFESYEWTPQELDTVFEVFVWPWLPKLPVEGVHSPTSLLKLFIVWSKFQRYFPLLGKHDCEGADPLTSVMELLVGAKTHNSVINAVLEMVERLLLLQDLQEECADDAGSRMDSDSAVIPLSVNNAPVFLHEPFIISDGGSLNYGSRLMMKHIPSVLERLKLKLSGRLVDCRLKKHELTILSRATELVCDPATSDVLLSLLLPIMLKKASAGDDIVCPILNTLRNLIRNVCDPSLYIYKLAPLFGIVSTAESRKLVTQIITSISKKETEIDEELIEDLNAFDKRWIEQPDFDRRLDAFKCIKRNLESNDLSVTMGIIIIHNCFYFITNEKDLSIRDNAVQCLQNLCPALCLNYPNFHDVLMDGTILPLISSSIKNKKNDFVKQEAVILLGYMVRECSDLHPALKDMSPLANKLDAEVDFFENLLHLQLHRRVRALLKLSDVLRSLKKSPCPRTLTQFLLPLVRQFLCEEKYLNKNTIVDAAIMALETICKFLPWRQYELILRYYLKKLAHDIQFQKQLVRVIVSILNGFHFDLSKASSYEIEKTHSALKTNAEPDDESENKKEVEDNERGILEEEAEEKGDRIESEDELLNAMDEEENVVKTMEGDDFETEDSTVDKIIVLNKSSATRVLRTIKSSLLAQLLRAISMRSQIDTTHKVNRKHLGTDKDEEDVLRIPIALAAVKLLQKLPAEFLQQSLSGILMKLCTFLKSRLESVRRVTRETLQKVMVALGADYLSILIDEMTQLLTKGFHVHVLVFTLHSVLVVMKDLFLPGHVEQFLPSVIQVCKLDLFGSASDEKEVAQITGKLMEARAHKSFDVFHILGEFATENCLLDLIVPLKEELSNSLSHKVVWKVTECLRNLVLGLVDNKFVSVESLLIFAYGIVSESIPSLASFDTDAEELAERNRGRLPSKPTDTFIIPEDPKGRPKVQKKQCEKTNAHVLVEFGLQLYYFLLKRERVKGAEHRAHLDPIVPLLDNCLRSQHMKINTLAVQCLGWILKKDLPSLKAHIKSISQTMFSILHKYASSGLSKGENFDLVMATFKAVAVIVRDVKYYELEKEQLEALLLYCEQDINDHSRQATAFTLLKTILARKLDVPALHQVILKVEELSVTSNLDHSRLQARQIVHLFMSEYKLGKKFKDHLNFFIMHLDYDLQTGRESALEMLRSLINTLPQTKLKLHGGLLFVSIAARLVNDDIPECREKAAQLIVSLLERVDKNERNNLFDIVLLWLKDKKVAHQRLGAQLCGIFASVERSDFENYLPQLFPLISKQFYDGFHENKPGALMRIAPESTGNERSSVSTIHDHHLYQLLNMLIKVVTFCPNVLTNANFTKDVEAIADNAQRLLGHPHEWVRSAALQLLGQIISVLNCEEIADIANGDRPEKPGFFFNDTFQRIKSFTLDHCYQLSPGVELNEKLLMQCMKNLVFVAEILQCIKSNRDNKEKPLVSLTWLVRRMRKLIHMEVAQSHPPSTVVRTMVFHWMAAIALKLNKESLVPIAAHILAPLVREMNIGDEGNAMLKRIAKEACGYVKRKVGLEEFNRLVTTCTTQLDIRRAQRRKERAQQMIIAPEKAAKRKIMKQQKKKVQKKRKVEALKKHKFKKQIPDVDS